MTCFAIGNRRGDISKYRNQCEHCPLDDCEFETRWKAWCDKREKEEK